MAIKSANFSSSTNFLDHDYVWFNGRYNAELVNKSEVLDSATGFATDGSAFVFEDVYGALKHSGGDKFKMSFKKRSFDGHVICEVHLSDQPGGKVF